MGYWCMSFLPLVELANCQVLEIALASREEVVLATDGIREPRDGEEEEMMERGARPMPSKEAMDKFVPFGRLITFEDSEVTDGRSVAG